MYNVYTRTRVAHKMDDVRAGRTPHNIIYKCLLAFRAFCRHDLTGSFLCSYSGYGPDTEHGRHRPSGPADLRPVSESVPVVGHLPVRPAQSDRMQQGPDAVGQLQQQRRRQRRTGVRDSAGQRAAVGGQVQVASPPPPPQSPAQPVAVAGRRGRPAPPETAAALEHAQAVVRPQQRRRGRRRRRQLRGREVRGRGTGETGIRVFVRGLGLQKVQPFRVVLRGRRVQHHQHRYVRR